MNPQKEIEKALKREDWLRGIGTEWRYPLAVRQICRSLYRSIRSDYLEQLRLNALTVHAEWTVHPYTQFDENERLVSNTFGLGYIPTGFHRRDKSRADRAASRIRYFEKLKTTETSSPLLSDIAEVFKQKHGGIFNVSCEEGRCVCIVLEGPHPVAKI